MELVSEKKNSEGNIVERVFLRENGTKRVQQFTHGDDCKVDQSHKAMCDIKGIMESYSKTGHLPYVNQKEPVYADVSNLPSFMEAHEIVQEAREAFMELPAAVRKKLDNNPANLEEYLSQEENWEEAAKYGLIEKIHKPLQMTDPNLPEQKQADSGASA